MKFDLYSRVALAEDLPERGLRRGDVVTIVDHHAGAPVRNQVTASRSSMQSAKRLMW